MRRLRVDRLSGKLPGGEWHVFRITCLTSHRILAIRKALLSSGQAHQSPTLAPVVEKGRQISILEQIAPIPVTITEK